MFIARKMLRAVAVSTIFSVSAAAGAHGFVGDRFFPATVTTDDPLATDELALPEFSYFESPGDPGGEARTADAGFEFDKLIVPKLTLGVSDDYLWQKPRGGPGARGWDNLTLSLKYQLWENAPHESVVSVGMETDLGGTGSKSAGRDSYTTFVPTVYFGKGFGDLPDALWPLKPLAVTGTLGLDFPTEARDSSALEWGLALEYNLPYLQQQVKDVSLPEPFKNMIPVVEFSNTSPFNRQGGMTTGTVNPGVLYESRYFQIGAEALIPVNRESGDHVGGIVVLEIYIDDLFPKIFGHPIFGD